MKMQKGVTLLEVMIALAVIAILATYAVPSYQEYMIRGKVVEATASLADGRIKMEQFFQDNRTYFGGEVRCPVATKYFTFQCATVDAAPGVPSSYMITANGIGNLSDYHYTIDQSNAKTSTTPLTDPPNVAVTCWVIKQGGYC